MKFLATRGMNLKREGEVIYYTPDPSAPMVCPQALYEPHDGGITSETQADYYESLSHLAFLASIAVLTAAGCLLLATLHYIGWL